MILPDHSQTSQKQKRHARWACRFSFFVTRKADSAICIRVQCTHFPNHQRPKNHVSNEYQGHQMHGGIAFSDDRAARLETDSAFWVAIEGHPPRIRQARRYGKAFSNNTQSAMNWKVLSYCEINSVFFNTGTISPLPRPKPFCSLLSHSQAGCFAAEEATILSWPGSSVGRATD